ncbi:MAG TPA: ABC transporter permease [Vicinamibacteria bacterium]|nr:ABC transporter permease [Vicinamibacteria bacterium]
MLSSFLQDVRYAVRTFGQRPAFTAVVVLTLALGIGSNVAIFSVANAVLLRPLPYGDPESLVLIWNRMANANRPNAPVSGPDFLDYKEQTRMFEDFAGAIAVEGTITGEERPEQVMVGWSTHNLFKVLGVRPFMGRDFEPADGTQIDPKVFMDPNAKLPPGALMLTHGMWQRQFGADPRVLGKGLQLDGQACVIVGVLPPDFHVYLPAYAGMPTNIDAWRVFPVDFSTSPRDGEWLTVVARMKADVTLEQAQAEMDALATRFREQFQHHRSVGMEIVVNSMHRDVVEHVRPLLLTLLAAVAFVLLIACANVANLLLVRAKEREREIAVRAALGGAQRRIIAQMLTESGVLALAGGILGTALAWVGIRVMVAMQPVNLPRFEGVSIDGTVMVFTAGASLLAALVFGVAPALKSASPNLASALMERGSDSGGVRGNKLRTVLVVSEVALSLVLLIGAGLMARSFRNLQQVDPGFHARNVLTLTVPLPFFKYRDPEMRVSFFDRLCDRIAALPGVEAVGGSTPIPLGGGDQYWVLAYGREGATEEEWATNRADYRAALPGYTQAMGIRLILGRALSEADNQPNAQQVIVIDEKLAQQTWPDDDPIGKGMQIVKFDTETMDLKRQSVQVVGMVEHVKSESLTTDGRGALYFPYRFFPWWPMTLTVRGEADPLGFVTAIRREVETLDPDVPIADVRLMEDYVSDAMAPARFTLTLVGVFSLLALVLASIGLYGVMSYSLRQRIQEIGVRMAFGAGARNIMRLLLRHGLALSLSGVVVGVIVSILVTRLAASLLFGVTPTDPVTFVGIPLILVGVAALASYIPARRATRIDPVHALRGESR